jgi:hypothetical protein
MVYNCYKKKQSKGGLACVSGSTNGLEEKRIKGVGEKSNGRERLTDEKKIKNPGEKEVDFPCSKTWNEGIYKKKKKGARRSGRNSRRNHSPYLSLFMFFCRPESGKELYGGEPTTSARIVTGQQTACYLSRPTPSPTLNQPNQKEERGGKIVL